MSTHRWCLVAKLCPSRPFFGHLNSLPTQVDIWCNNAGINHNAGWRKCMDIDIVSRTLLVIYSSCLNSMSHSWLQMKLWVSHPFVTLNRWLWWWAPTMPWTGWAGWRVRGNKEIHARARNAILGPKNVKISVLNLRVNHFLAGGRGGLIVNTASAAGLVFNQVGNEFNLSICTPALAQTDTIK